MRHHTAAQKGEGGGWHYVSLHPRRGGYPIGYCGEHEPHPTELEARECYSKYRRDNVRIDGKLHNWTGCEHRDSPDGPVCDQPTKNIATIWGDGFAQAALCDDHISVENAIKALGLDRPAGDAWRS